jgi:hypothetical protein
MLALFVEMLGSKFEVGNQSVRAAGHARRRPEHV